MADDLDQLADSITIALEPLRGQPVALFGHSMGAAVAYEVTGRLEKRWPHAPERLFLSSFPPPTQLPHTTVHQRDDRGLIAELVRLAPGNEALTSRPELIELMLPAIRNDYRVIETYHPSGTVLSCPVTTLIGDRDPDITPADMLGWQPFTRGSFSSRVLAGDHFYLTTQPETVVTKLLREIGPTVAPA
jgi:surfactin synthase thioesterase subunit